MDGLTADVMEVGAQEKLEDDGPVRLDGDQFQGVNNFLFGALRPCG